MTKGSKVHEIEGNKLISEVLTSERDVLAAKQLLHQVYVHELGWKISVENPSNLRTLNVDGLPHLEDKFEQEAIWLGIKSGSRVVGILRVLLPKTGRFEIEEYKALPDFLKTDGKSCEINRLALDSSFGDERVFPLLLEKTFLHCISRGFKYLFTSIQFPQPGDFFLSLGMKKVEGGDFKYTDFDPHPVSILYFDLSDKLRNEKTINFLSSLT